MAPPAKKKAKKANGSAGARGSLARFGFKDKNAGMVSAKGRWHEDDSVLSFRFPTPPRVAKQAGEDNCSSSKTVVVQAYDLDGTLIKTKSGRRFPTNNATDWTLWDANRVKLKLESAVAAGRRLVIFSNQGGIGMGKVATADFKTKIEAIVDRLGLCIDVYAAKQKDIARKPRLGLWDRFLSDVGAVKHGDGSGVGGITGPVVDVEASVYVGDAAGRSACAAKDFKADFADTDLKFAVNIGISFETPEQHFLADIRPHVVSPDPQSLPFQPSDLLPAMEGEGVGSSVLGTTQGDDDGEGALALALKQPPSKEVVVLVGAPAAGKSTLCKTRLSGHTRINQDTLKSVKRCIQACEEALGRGESVVIDATNRNAETRRPFVTLAKKHKCIVRAVVLKTPRSVVEHLNAYRGLVESDDQRTVPGMAFASFYKNVQWPGETPGGNEGFDEIVQVPFVARPPSDPTKRKLLSQFLI